MVYSVFESARFFSHGVVIHYIQYSSSSTTLHHCSSSARARVNNPEVRRYEGVTSIIHTTHYCRCVCSTAANPPKMSGKLPYF